MSDVRFRTVLLILGLSLELGYAWNSAGAPLSGGDPASLRYSVGLVILMFVVLAITRLRGVGGLAAIMIVAVTGYAYRFELQGVVQHVLGALMPYRGEQVGKVERAGRSDAVDGRVLIYIHKEEALDDVERRYPAAPYVLLDDKLRILEAVKRVWGGRVTTVFPRQGIYAHDPQVISAFPPADITIERIGDLLDFDLPRLQTASRPLAST
jgi:hypothetical protein